MKKVAIIARIFQFFPLLFFIFYASRHGTPTDIDWLYSFQISAVIAILYILLFIVIKLPLNRFVLGANVYLIIGGIFVFFDCYRPLEILNYLRDTGVLIAILGVAIIFTLCSPRGFINSDQNNNKVKTYSWIMVAFICVAILINVLIPVKNYYPITALIIGGMLLNKYLCLKIKRSEQ